MDVTANFTPEANDNPSNTKTLFTEDHARKIKNQTATSSNEYETDSKANLKVEERCTYDTTTSNSDFETKNKMPMKEEPDRVDEEPNFEYFNCTNPEIKMETDVLTGYHFMLNTEIESRGQEFEPGVTSQNDTCSCVHLAMGEKDSVNCNYRHMETITKIKIDVQPEVTSVSDISPASEFEGSDLERNNETEDLTTESPRLSKHVVDHGNSLTFPDASNLKLANGKNFNRQTCKTGNICSLHYNLPHGSEHLDTTDESKLLHRCKNINNLWVCRSQLTSGHDTCEKCFKRKSDFKTDLLVLSGTDEAHNCLTTNSILDQNTLFHLDTKQHKCEHCGKCFARKSYLKVHELLHAGTKPFECEHCHKCFAQKSYLNKHYLFHSATKSYKCETCDKCFTQRSDFNRHTLLHLGEKPYKCEYCNAGFIRSSDLKAHELLHSDTKPYKCEHCEKSFTRKSYLKVHQLLHSDIKPYKCDQCDKCFKHKSDLNKHKLFHSGSKPYKCEHCNKCFTQRSDLNKHKFVHLGIKPYKCEHCDKSFTETSTLNKHRLIHSGIKAYKCDQCGKCFTQKSTLHKHRFVHSDTKAYKCEVCDKSFTLKSNLDKHRLLHAGRNPRK